jgi:hypothetical protein
MNTLIAERDRVKHAFSIEVSAVVASQAVPSHVLVIVREAFVIRVGDLSKKKMTFLAAYA